MSERLEGKVAFITGIARGQGRCHALRLAEQGADIVGLDLCEQIATVDYPLSTIDDLNETISQVESLGRRIVANVGDVRDRNSLRSTIEAGFSEFGRLDFVIANAGIMPTHGQHSSEVQAWQDCLDVLLTGAMNTVELTYPRLVEQGEGGSIVIISSMAAFAPMMRTEQAHSLGLLGYCASKFALINLARNYASILAYHRIRVNTIHPTGVNTPMIRNAMLDNYFQTANPEDLKTLVNAIPVDAVESDDVANLVKWLCSDESRYITGSEFKVDAGASLR